MEKWLRTTIILCSFGFLKEFRPSEPYLTSYLVGSWKNLTVDEVYSDVFPVWTYSYLALLVVVFLVTDYLLYKPVIIFDGLCYVSTYIVLIWGQGVPAMQGVEVLYAAATAAQVAYSAYVYTVVPVERFQLVTGYTQAALLAGRCLGGVAGQVLVATGLCDYYSLNFISLGATAAATVVAAFLPAVERSVYFHRGSKDDQVESEKGWNGTTRRLADTGALLWFNLRASFGDASVLKWSLWWAVAMAGYFQVLNYIQTLWNALATETNDTALWNGAVESLQSFLGALAALGVGYVRIDWSQLGEPVIAFISLLEGAMLLLAGLTDRLWVAYLAYMIFNISYSVMITIATSEVAKGLKEEAYGLVFGLNTFTALLVQTILTLIVADSVGLALLPDKQVYGCYFFVLGAAFLVMTSYRAGRRWGCCCFP